MINKSDIVTVDLTTDELADSRVFANAGTANIGGVSHIFSNRDERSTRSSEDQLTGQICNYAASVYYTGDAEAYIYSRERANATPCIGDGGVDIPGRKADIKGSLMRGSVDPMKYHLYVRPQEYHRDWRYTLTLTRPISNGYRVHLVGEAVADILKWVETKYVLPASDLMPLSPRGIYSSWRDSLRGK